MRVQARKKVTVCCRNGEEQKVKHALQRVKGYIAYT